MSISRVFHFFDSDSRFLWMASKGAFKKMDDREYLERFYKALMKRKLNLDPPTTYNEKLQWLKLYDHNPLYTKLVDKYEVKAYVANMVGSSYVIPTLGIYNSFDEIDFRKLPNQFVIKCTHDSGGLCICKDKNSFDYHSARSKITKSLKTNYYWIGREWPYKDVVPRVIVEEYKEDYSTGELRDYKFFCFNGEVKALFVATDRQKAGTDVKFDYFDEEYNHLAFKQGHENASKLPDKPTHFNEMKEVARKLSEGFPHVRIDLYEANGNVYFGEMTFSHFSGAVPFNPEEYDKIFGDWINLGMVKISNNL